MYSFFFVKKEKSRLRSPVCSHISTEHYAVRMIRTLAYTTQYTRTRTQVEPHTKNQVYCNKYTAPCIKNGASLSIREGSGGGVVRWKRKGREQIIQIFESDKNVLCWQSARTWCTQKAYTVSRSQLNENKAHHRINEKRPSQSEIQSRAYVFVGSTGKLNHRIDGRMNGKTYANHHLVDFNKCKILILFIIECRRASTAIPADVNSFPLNGKNPMKFMENITILDWLSSKHFLFLFVTHNFTTNYRRIQRILMNNENRKWPGSRVCQVCPCVRCTSIQFDTYLFLCIIFQLKIDSHVFRLEYRPWHLRKLYSVNSAACSVSRPSSWVAGVCV